MNLTVTRGKVNKPYKVVIYGPEGVGKTTLASKFPDPLWIDSEDSTTRIDVKRYPKPIETKDVIDMINNSIWEKNCQTIVIDSIDKVEKMFGEEYLKKEKKKNLQEGYGAGRQYVFIKMGELLNELDKLIEKGINVILIGHSKLRKFEQPNEQGAYDRYQMNLQDGTNTNVSDMVKAWADMVLFCNYETYVIDVDKNGKGKAQGGKRVIYTEHSPSWDAKNRDGLPKKMDLDFKGLSHLFNNQKKEKLHNDVKVEHDLNEEPPRIVDVEQVNADLIGDVEGLPKELIDLMIKDTIFASELKEAIVKAKIYSSDTSFDEYDPNIIKTKIIDKWDGFKGYILTKIRKF